MAIRAPDVDNNKSTLWPNGRTKIMVPNQLSLGFILGMAESFKYLSENMTTILITTALQSLPSTLATNDDVEGWA